MKYFEEPAEGGVWDVVIVGSGPSAFTASIYTSRGAASTLMLGGHLWGGQLMLTTDVDNFPGFPGGIEGPKLMGLMREQVERFGVNLVEKDVVEVNFSNSPFELKTEDGSLYKAKSVIVATGAKTLWLGVPGEDRLLGRGVSSCAPCDAPFFKDKRVVVVGGGDSACEEAVVLTKYATEVYLVHRRDSLKAGVAMQRKVLNNEKIKIVWDTEVSGIEGEDRVSEIILKTTKGSKGEQFSSGYSPSVEGESLSYKFPIDGVFVAIGHSPSGDIFSSLEKDEKGYIKKKQVEGFSTSTSVEGVFVCGDVHDSHYRQAITAAGFGCMAAMDTLSYLDKLKSR